MTSAVKGRKYFLCPYSNIQSLGTMFVLKQKLGRETLGTLCSESTFSLKMLLFCPLKGVTEIGIVECITSSNSR